MADARLQVEPEGLSLSGTLTFATVAALEQRARTLLPGLPDPARVNLEGVARIDSAGVALLVTLWRRVQRQGGRLGFYALPEGLQPLLELYDLQAVLGADDPETLEADR